MIPIDKQLHFFSNYMGATLIYLPLYLMGVSDAILLACVAMFIVGLSKEIIWDLMLAKGNPESLDVFANSLGIILAGLFLALL